MSVREKNIYRRLLFWQQLQERIFRIKDDLGKQNNHASAQSSKRCTKHDTRVHVSFSRSQVCVLIRSQSAKNIHVSHGVVTCPTTAGLKGSLLSMRPIFCEKLAQKNRIPQFQIMSIQARRSPDPRKRPHRLHQRKSCACEPQYMWSVQVPLRPRAM